MAVKILRTHKRIAMVAHDHKKTELINWAVKNIAILARHELVATGTTGRLLEEAIDIPVRQMLSGPLGGDQQMGAMIASGAIDMMIFFWDPMEAQPHDSDVKALLRLGVVWNIPMACCQATADFLLTSPYMYGEYEATIPDYSDYLQRPVGEESSIK